MKVSELVVGEIYQWGKMDRYFRILTINPEMKHEYRDDVFWVGTFQEVFSKREMRMSVGDAWTLRPWGELFYE